MTRISPHARSRLTTLRQIAENLLVQQVEGADDRKDRYVILDDSTGAEITLSATEAGRLLYVLGTYFNLPVVGPDRSPA